MTDRRIAVETWDPDYGAPVDAAVLDPSKVSVNADVELDARAWKPLSPAPDVAPPAEVLFVDGVRRTDASAWITEGAGPPYRAILASIGAGAVLAGGRAQVVAAEVERLLIAPQRTANASTRAGNYAAAVAAGTESDDLSRALQQRLAALETRVAEGRRDAAEMIFLDGPLRGWPQPHAVGYIKSHRVSYLPEALQSIVGRLAAGQRTPLFLMTTSWSRYSWYLRLPGPASHAWWGIVRCEVSDALAAADARRAADRATALLPRFASSPHKDARAPQNLHPIAGLEGRLRRLLGDAAFVRRCIRELR